VTTVIRFMRSIAACRSPPSAGSCTGVRSFTERQWTRAIAAGIAFLRRAQRADGAYPGVWGINFTYGTFHAVRGLRACGIAADDPVLVRAAQWPIGARDGGGWGEHYSGCLDGRYVEHAESQVVMTAWALLALMEVVDVRSEAVARGIAWLRSKQAPDGSWPQQAVNGVFFWSAMLDYRLYKSYFPTWALSRHAAPTLNVPPATRAGLPLQALP
jgi:lanosterol synthase